MAASLCTSTCVLCTYLRHLRELRRTGHSEERPPPGCSIRQLSTERAEQSHQAGTSLQHQSQHWLAPASALFSRAVREGSRSFHNHGEGPLVLAPLYTRPLRHRSTIARWSAGDKQQIAAIQPDLEYIFRKQWVQEKR